MNDIAISIKNISKSYRMYLSPTERLKELLHPFGKKYHKEFWALKDISLDVKKGETIGIIGRNGSGKSTLLQLICKVLQPTNGEIKINGRISALLELGAGFNKEFTGRENVYMNGALMGFSQVEMDEKFQSIVDFADIGDFIEQPVKTYSSGMFVRLAFSLAVSVDPDILVVDEALAVGDNLFQKRCYEKIESMVSQGTTLLFVSHDQESIRTVTSRALLMDAGKNVMFGKSSEVVLEYRRMLHNQETAYYASLVDNATVARNLKSLSQRNRELVRASTTSPIGESDGVKGHSKDLSFGDHDAEITEVLMLNGNGEPATTFEPGHAMLFRISFIARVNIDHLNVALRIRNKEGVKMYSWGTLNQDISIWAGKTRGEVFWDRHFLAGEEATVEFCCECNLGANFYEVQASLTQERDKYYAAQRILHWKDEAAFFYVSMPMKEYFFGGACDMKMVSNVRH
jgi:lipopolysaccharide transport system ATP-binding protein